MKQFALLVIFLLFTNCSDDCECEHDIVVSTCDNFVITTEYYHTSTHLPGQQDYYDYFSLQILINFGHPFQLAKFSDLKNLDDIDALINCLDIGNDSNNIYFLKDDIISYYDDNCQYPYLIYSSKIANLPNGTSIFSPVAPISVMDVKVDNIGNLALCYTLISGFNGQILGFKDE